MKNKIVFLLAVVVAVMAFGVAAYDDLYDDYDLDVDTQSYIDETNASIAAMDAETERFIAEIEAQDASTNAYFNQMTENLRRTTESLDAYGPNAVEDECSPDANLANMVMTFRQNGTEMGDIAKTMTATLAGTGMEEEVMRIIRDASSQPVYPSNAEKTSAISEFKAKYRLKCLNANAQ